ERVAEKDIATLLTKDWLQNMAGQGRELRPQLAGVGIWLFPVDDEGSGVLSGDVLDEVLGYRGKAAGVRIRVDAPREDEVFSFERRTVVPGEVGGEPVRRLHPTVGRDLPGISV